MKPLIGKVVPDISLEATGGHKFNLKEIEKPFALYFYPKDATPGCTQEGRDFARLYKRHSKT